MSDQVPSGRPSVLERGSPLPLSIVRGIQKRQGTAALQNAGVPSHAPSVALGGSTLELLFGFE
jgi:hypothetical protein